MGSLLLGPRANRPPAIDNTARLVLTGGAGGCHGLATPGSARSMTVITFDNSHFLRAHRPERGLRHDLKDEVEAHAI